MNIFRITGDLLHYTAILTIFVKIVVSRSCQGISGKSQILFFLVYISRYLDLFFNFISLYNTTVKVLLILSSLTNILLVFVKYRGTISDEIDNFRVELLVAAAAVLALLVNHEFSVLEVAWTFSVYLEAVAIAPQLAVSSKGKTVEPVILFYLISLAGHKLFYCFNWIYRYQREGHYDGIAVAAGLAQTMIYANFFVLYIIKRISTSKLEASV